MKYLCLNVLVILSSVLVACSPEQVTIPGDTQPVSSSPQAIFTQTPPPTKTVIPPPIFTSTLSPMPIETTTPITLNADDLKALLETEYSTEKIRVVALTAPLWAAYSYGEILDLPLESHFVALYSAKNDTWEELDRIDLGAEPAVLVDVSSVSIEPNNLWLDVSGGRGANSDCNILIRFDGQDLHKEVSHCNRYDAGRFEDVNLDGVMEVVQDWTDYYVYCGACQEKLTNFKVLRWDGQQLVDVDLQFLDTSMPEEIRQLNNLAVALAQAELWKDAQGTIDQASKLDDQNVKVTWNKILIDLQANERRKEANSFLTTLFFGAYDNVLDMMREYSAQELFEAPVELTTITEFDDGWQKEATINWVLKMTDSTIEYQPEFAPAYFLRGWAKYLNDDLSALQDVGQAVQLDPTEPLFSEGLEYLQNIN